MAGRIRMRGVVIVVGTLMLLFVAVLVPKLKNAKAQVQRSSCVGNVKKIGLVFRILANDNDGVFPHHLSEENGGTMESAFRGDLVPTFRAMSNELSITRMLVCPSEPHKEAGSWGDLTEQNISYFIGLDAVDTKPNMILSGDRNLAVDGELLSGLVELGTNSPVEFTDEMHDGVGNIGLADGSVQRVNSELLRQQLRNSEETTNRFVFPQ